MSSSESTGAELRGFTENPGPEADHVFVSVIRSRMDNLLTIRGLPVNKLKEPFFAEMIGLPTAATRMLVPELIRYDLLGWGEPINPNQIKFKTKVIDPEQAAAIIAIHMAEVEAKPKIASLAFTKPMEYWRQISKSAGSKFGSNQLREKIKLPSEPIYPEEKPAKPPKRRVVPRVTEIRLQDPEEVDLSGWDSGKLGRLIDTISRRIDGNQFDIVSSHDIPPIILRLISDTINQGRRNLGLPALSPDSDLKLGEALKTLRFFERITSGTEDIRTLAEIRNRIIRSR